VDSHAHVFDEGCVYLAGSRYTPKAFAPAARYVDLLDRHGIAGGVLVQPSFLGTDNSFMLRAIAGWPHRLRGVAVVPLAVEPRELATLRAQGVRAVRLNLVGVDDPDYAAPEWRRWLVNVRDAGLPVDLHATGERWGRILPPLLDFGLSVVIEHLGRPGTEDPMQCPGFRAVLAAAASGNAWVKLSAPYRMPDGAAERAVPLLLERYGAERLLWGSDCPWTQHEDGKTMPGAMDWLSRLGLTGAQMAAIAGGSARVLYDLPAVSVAAAAG
jgi:predicted TIM-barrel fold metal-dependent hydrolase